MKGGDCMADIGKNIAERRKELGLTQEELASRMGYRSKSTINKIELGKNDIPQSKIVKFAEVLQTTPAWLMGWEKIQKNNDTIADIVVRMRTDSDFMSVVEDLHSLDETKFSAVRQMLSAFLK
jgi:transcriptional regulator with XRE-family HTH domain